MTTNEIKNSTEGIIKIGNQRFSKTIVKVNTQDLLNPLTVQLMPFPFGTMAQDKIKLEKLKSILGGRMIGPGLFL